MGAAGEPPKSWGGSRFPLLEACHADLCIFISDHQACLVFFHNCSECQGKGTQKTFLGRPRGFKAEGIGGVLIQMWPGAVGASAATAADAGMYVH